MVGNGAPQTFLCPPTTRGPREQAGSDLWVRRGARESARVTRSQEMLILLVPATFLSFKNKF